MSDERQEPPMTRDEMIGYHLSSCGDVHRLLLYIDDLHHIIRECVDSRETLLQLPGENRYRDYYAAIRDRTWELPDLPIDESETP